MEPELLRSPPHSIEAEQSLIGAVLVNNSAFEQAGGLAPDAFYADRHRRLWAVICKRLEGGNSVDIVTICDELGDDLEKAGGAAYIADCAQHAGFSVKSYAALISEKATLRALAQRGMDIADRALSGTTPPMELAEDACAAFLDIQGQTDNGDPVEFGKALLEAVEWLDNPSQGLLTGYPTIDSLLRGLQPGDFMVVAGRPSMGKTALAMNIAEHVAARHTVAVLSLEMTRKKLAGRALRYHEANLGRAAALDHLYALKMHIDDASAMTVGQARVRLRKIQRRHGLSLVVVDYLQLMQGKGENRTQEVSAISRGLKAIAKDLGIVVIAVAQLNRGVESRTDARPHLADLRESGQIEQDADVIAFVYREEYYKPDTEWLGIAEVIVRKHRDGPIGTAYLEWLPDLTRFRTLERALPMPSTPEPGGKVARFSDFKSRAAGDSAA